MDRSPENESNEEFSRSVNKAGIGCVISFVVLATVMGLIFVPWFVKYMRNIGRTEAIDELDQIYKGAAFYYSAPHIDADGGKLPCQFPASQGVTPAESCCKKFGGPDKDGDDRCDVNATAWNSRTWSVLKFTITDQANYVYSFDQHGDAGQTDPHIRSEQEMLAPYAAATANGDVDCDGTQSTYQRLMFTVAHVEGTACSISSSAFFVDNETE